MHPDSHEFDGNSSAQDKLPYCARRDSWSIAAVKYSIEPSIIHKYLQKRSTIDIWHRIVYFTFLTLHIVKQTFLRLSFFFDSSTFDSSSLSVITLAIADFIHVSLTIWNIKHHDEPGPELSYCKKSSLFPFFLILVITSVFFNIWVCTCFNEKKAINIFKKISDKAKSG